jgi:predicted metalloprotease with PDZ domain
MTEFPQPIPQPPRVPEPRDVAYCAPLRLHVDAVDVTRRIYRACVHIPVASSGPMTLLYPKWLPGFHAPQAPIELFAGLVITANGTELTWKRHPVTINAFHLDVPEGTDELVATFQFLSPTDPAQGRVIVTSEILTLQWNTVVLYPAGHFARQIEVEPSLTLPPGWRYASALETVDGEDGAIRFNRVSLDVLVDSPVFAGRHFRRLELDNTVSLNLVADRPELLAATPEQIDAHRAVVVQCDRLFGTRHFERYAMLLALSEELTSAGVEHHGSFDAVTLPSYFTNWASTFTRRDTIPHEYVHSWNGKHRRGADSWSPCFEWPIRNSLMWVYEGQTQYWTHVLAARSGLWTAEQALGSLAHTAATYDQRPGSRWRPMIDTTRDPIIAARAPLPWASWQRSEDYYSEGALTWLDVDTRLREMSGDSRSLDDFARNFFGSGDPTTTTNTYVYSDVVETLNALVPFDWGDMLHTQVTEKREGTLLDGIVRGGYDLVYHEHPNPYSASLDALTGQANLSFSLGVIVGSDGTLSEVLWESPAFDAGLTVGTQILAVGGTAFTQQVLKNATAKSVTGKPIEVLVKAGQQVRVEQIDYSGGLRYPHFERREGARARLDEILTPLQTG